MKHLIVAALIAAPLLSFGQPRDSAMQLYVNRAGIELQAFARKRSTGATMQIGGAAIAGLGMYMMRGSNEAVPLIAGGIISLIGTAVSFSANKHAIQAGQYLQLAGGGLAIPLPKKTRANARR